MKLDKHLICKLPFKKNVINYANMLSYSIYVKFFTVTMLCKLSQKVALLNTV